ncbi:MAG: hydroxymethylglutaryl-CoA reductase, degradative [Haloarculaceae archaeon]
MDSRVPGFYRHDRAERISIVRDRCDLSTEAVAAIQGEGTRVADRLSENVLGTLDVPLSVATNFVIDGEDYFVPMATEESSVVAAASHGAKMARPGGFETSVSEPHMIGQVQVVDVPDPHAARARVLERRDEIRETANDLGILVDHGGGCRDVTARAIATPRGGMVIVHLIVDVRDAMGANAVNAMAEAVAPVVEEITGGEVSLRVLSNLADRRMARARCRIAPDDLEHDESDLSGEEVRDRIVDAWAFADGDPYRAATHNKGIMNAIDALALATMNDWRALEAGAHAYAASDGYGPLTTFEVDEEGFLTCAIELPVQVGTVGGATRTHPMAEAAMEILGVDSEDEFARVFAALGLAENLASPRALTGEGIQRGHMKLHAENVAAQADAPEDLIDEVAARMVAEEDVRESRARELLDELA